MKLDYVIHGNSNHTGFGIHCRNMIKALSDAGKTVAFVPIQSMQHQIIDDDIKTALDNRIYITGSEPGIMIYHAENMIKFCGNPRMGFAIFESDKIPELELAYYKTLDKILVPSNWGVHVLEKNINDSLENYKIKVIPEGYDPEIFHVKHGYEFNIERAKRRGYYTFLHVGKWERRKNTGMIVRAFKQAINDIGISAQLIIKCDNPFNPEWHEEFDSARSVCHHICVYAEGQKVDEQDMADIYREADFGLYASSGEAWNLPLLESLACGLPSICTSAGGQSEYLRDCPKDLIIQKTVKEIADDGMFFKGDRGNWDVPDRDELKAKIKYVLQNPEAVIKRKQEYADSVKGFTWENAVRGLLL